MHANVWEAVKNLAVFRQCNGRKLEEDEDFKCVFIIYYCINTSVTQYKLPCINGNQNCVLIRDVRGVNARSLLTYVLNHEYLIAAQIVHSIIT